MIIKIIGAGIAGLTVSHVLQENDIQSEIIEKQSLPGGLSKSFEMAGEWFDLGGHATFAKDAFVRTTLESGVDFNTLKAVAYNYKYGKWIKNPVQINLAELDTKEKISILLDYFQRPSHIIPENYMQWLEKYYGRYFAENYPKLYTEKYWTVEPEQLETKWVGIRMYQPTVEEVLYGAFEKETPEVHYSGEIRYPKIGGFESFIKKLETEANIKLNQNIANIDVTEKLISFDTGEKRYYDILVNTAPLPEIIKLIDRVPVEVQKAANNLNATSLILVSIAIKGKLKTDMSPGFYIYDSNIPATRVYSTTKYSGQYKGVTALQAEVFISKFRLLHGSYEEIASKVVQQLSDIGMFDMNNVIAKNVRFEPYANIIFTPDIYENRDKVRSYLDENNIICAGRFGEWDYLWTDQAMLSGKKAAEQVMSMLKEV